MAYDDFSGKIAGFNYSDKQLENKIEEYKSCASAGDILLPSWPDFCTFLGVPAETLEAVMEQGFAKKGAYYDRAVALKNMGEWCEAQLVSNPNWGGKMAVKAMFLLKQGLGRSRKYTDERTANVQGPAKIELNFGAGDPRGKKAGK